MADNPQEPGAQQEASAAGQEESAAGQEESAADAAATDSESAGQNYSPDELRDNESQNDRPPADVNLDLILDVPVSVSLQVGSTEITIRDLVQLVDGSVVALDRESSEAMDVMVNGTLIAHGEIVVVDDSFGIRLTDVVSPAERIRNIN